MGFARILGIALLCVLAAAVSASAQAEADDQVFVDPDGPAGREYELPLDAAREDAAGGSARGSDASGRQSAPLFGAGIEPPADSRDSKRNGAPDTKGARGATQDDARSPSAGAPAGAGVRRAEVNSTTQSVLPIALGGFLVLAIGALIGLVLRHPDAKSDPADG